MHGPSLTHTHSHEESGAPAEVGPAPSPTAAVAIDVGAGKGALILYPSERFRGYEIEISPVDDARPRVHTGVHERGTPAGTRLTAVFGSLAAGDYVVWEDETTAGPTVTVPDGAVAELELD